MPDVVYQTATTADRIDFMSKTAKQVIAARIGISVSILDAKDIAKLTEMMTKEKKPVEFVVSFDGDGINYFARVGSKKYPITAINIANDSSLDLDKVLNNLVSQAVTTKDKVVAFKKAHPDKKALDALKKQIDELDKKLKEDQKKLADLKKEYTDMGGK
jgi:vacuolar-type H+-ATPase subunit I/STV1